MNLCSGWQEFYQLVARSTCYVFFEEFTRVGVLVRFFGWNSRSAGCLCLVITAGHASSGQRISKCAAGEFGSSSAWRRKGSFEEEELRRPLMR